MKIIRLFACLLFSSFIYAQEQSPMQQIFPPYPDVWGYDISDFPAINDGLGGIEAYRMQDGDIWFVIDYVFKYKDPLQEQYGGYEDQKYILLKFFKGEKILLDEKQRDELYETLEGERLFSYDTVVRFKDGSTLKVYHGHSPKVCYVPDFIKHYYVKTDGQNNDKKYSILGVKPHVRVFEDEALCEAQGAPFLYQKLNFLGDIIDLGDDTFIAYTNGSNLILRFDKVLNTKFKVVNPTIYSDKFISRNFFVVDYSVIDELQGKNDLRRNVPVNQTVQDDLILYFKDLYQ